MPRSPTAILEDAVHVVEGMMQHSPSKANTCAHDEAQACCSGTRYFGVCDRMLVGLAILTIVRASPALAGEPAVIAAKSDFSVGREFAPTSALMLPLPPGYQTVPSTYQAVHLPAFE